MMKDKSWYWIIGGLIVLVAVNGSLFYINYAKNWAIFNKPKEVPSAEEKAAIEEMEMLSKTSFVYEVKEVTCVSGDKIYKMEEVVSEDEASVCTCTRQGVVMCKGKSK